MKRISLNKMIRGEKGQALLIVMLMIVVGGLVITPVLNHVQTGLKTGSDVYRENMYLTYAADAGIEDALWQVKQKNLPTLFAGYPIEYNQYAYYDYSDDNEWVYNLQDLYNEVGIVNGKNVDVTFQNVWMPKDIDAPSPSAAEDNIVNGRLAVFGSLSGVSATEYQIKMYYYFNNTDPEEPDYDPVGENLRVQEIGIWLPPGFDYVDNSYTDFPTTPSENSTPYKGGRAVTFSFSSPPRFIDFPEGSGTNPISRTITFELTGPEGKAPGTALSWFNTSGVSGVSFTWDSTVKIFKITSVASDEDNDFTVDAYAATTDALKRGAAIAGDYCAIGNTLMTTTTDQYFRDRLFKESSATVQSTNSQNPFYIPPDGHVDLAYLYWSGWIDNAAIWGDPCNNFDNWTYQTGNWSIDSGMRFKGHATYTGESYRTLTMTSSVDLSAYASETLQVTFLYAGGRTYTNPGNYLENDDGLDYALSYNGGSTWGSYQTVFRNDRSAATFTITLSSQYKTSQFKMRFRIYNCTGSDENVFIDEVTISFSGSSVERAKVNQVMFNGVKVTADPLTGIQTEQSGAVAGSLSYSCKSDVTDVVNIMISNEALGPNGSGTYTVGHVMDWPGSYQMYYTNGSADGTTAYPLGTPATEVNNEFPSKYQWSYAAWSLIIVYSSPDTAGHQLYLYEDLRYCDSSISYLSFRAGGFIAPESVKDEDHAAHLTCFVGEGDNVYDGDYIRITGQEGTPTKLWDGTTTGGNSQSSPNDVWNENSRGLAQSGIDIDTFTAAYPAIVPGSTYADIYIDTVSDAWNLVYIIVSFRSELVSSGTFSYLIRW